MINPVSLGVSGLLAASKKAGVAAENIANASSNGKLDGTGPKAYEASSVVTESVAGGGVQAVKVPRTPSFVPSYDPDSPFANSDGLVAAPNVNLDEELINLKIAEQAYKANAQSIRTGIEMHDTLLDAINKKV